MTIRSRSPGETTEPAGLEGVFRMMTLVRGVIARSIASAVTRKFAASSVGTLIEWYDFYIFGSLAAVLSLKFYPPGNDTFAYIAYLATFAVGFLVRPFGAIFFGRIGDKHIPVIAGIWPLVSVRNAEFLANEVPGVSVPEAIIARMRRANEKSKDHAVAEGIAIAREMLDRIKPLVQGAQVSAPFGKVELALQVFA